MQPTGTRPLAPAPSTTDSLQESPSGTLSPTHGHSPFIGIRRASTACQSCKQIKRKCDQAQPCSNCRKSKTRCVYNEAEDGRRKAARKRTVETLESKQDALNSILESFRTSTDRHAQGLLDLIRENVPLEEIVQYALIHKSDLPRPQFDDLVSQIHEQPRKSVMSVTALCDTPLVQVPSRPWTTVTTDDELVSHLISIFFTWYSTAYPTVDKDLFLRDMENGSLDCQFCSPLLVNAMLALACNFSDHPKSCRIPSDSNTRGQHFFNEATRLWNAQESRPSLVNIQSATLLAVVSCLVGKDRLSWSYVEQMNQMNDELHLKHRRMQKLGVPPPSAEISRAIALASETVFLMTVGYGIAFMKPSGNQIRPRENKHIPRTSRQSSKWIPYPQQLPEVTYHPDLLRGAYHELHTLGLRIQSLVFGSNGDSSVDSVAVLDEKLVEWRRSLPEELQLDSVESTVRPPVIDLHLAYHFIRMSLFSFIEGKGRPESTYSTSSIHGPSQASASIQSKAYSIHSIPAFTTSEQVSSSPHLNHQGHSLSYFQAQSLQSAKEIAYLCRLYNRDLGLKQTSIWMPQAAASAAYSLIDGPLSVADIEISEPFHELCSVLTAASRRWLVMKGHVRMLFMTAKTRGQTMLPKTRLLLQPVAFDQWRENDHKMFISSNYPNYALAKDSEDPRLSGMGDLLEMWAGISLGSDNTLAGDVLDNSTEGSRVTSATPGQ